MEDVSRILAWPDPIPYFAARTRRLDMTPFLFSVYNHFLISRMLEQGNYSAQIF